MTQYDTPMTVATPAKAERNRRDQIVQAAAAVLGRQGYTDTSLKQIAAEAGVAPGLLHYYFESKEDLLIEVVSNLEREISRDWQEAVQDLDDPLERIVAALDHAAKRCTEQPEFFRLLFDLYMLGLSNPAIRERCTELWGSFIDDIEGEVRQVLDRLPSSANVLPPRDLAAAIGGAIDGIALAAIVQNADPVPQYRALKALLLSIVVTQYVQAGEVPPVERFRELLKLGA
jgi:TetR/AcrR family transcriptional repressor of bet genes